MRKQNSLLQQQLTAYIYTVELQWLKHRWLDYHGCFELILEALEKNQTAAEFIIFGTIQDDFLFTLIMVCCVYSIESPHRGDSGPAKFQK